MRPIPIRATPAVHLSAPKQLAGLAGWLLCAFATAAVGAVASARAPSFYQQLSLPDWAPPASLFGPVWTVLYLLIGISAWLVWRSGGFRRDRMALSLYLAQLLFNALWSWIFFKWHEGAMAFAEIVLLWCLIAATLASFWRLQRAAAMLLIPYLAWVSFAAALCFSAWQRNPELL